MKILLTWKLFPWFKASLSGISPAILLRFCSPAVPDNYVGLCKKRSGTTVILKPKKRKNIFYLTWLVLFIWQILLFWDEMLLFWFTDQFYTFTYFIPSLITKSDWTYQNYYGTVILTIFIWQKLLKFWLFWMLKYSLLVGNHSKSWRPEIGLYLGLEAVFDFFAFLLGALLANVLRHSLFRSGVVTNAVLWYLL